MDERELAAAAFLTGSFADILAPDIVLMTDAATLTGRDECALHLAGVFAALAPESIDSESVNGEPGLAVRSRGRVLGVLVVHARGGLIEQLWLVTDPDKLRAWN